jgi:hypothetical protein
LISSPLRRFRPGPSWFSVIETVQQKSRVTTRCGWYDAYKEGWSEDCRQSPRGWGGHPLTPAEERALAEKLGPQYHRLPISLDKLDAAQVKELREILQNSQGTVFVHCGTGQRACSFSLAASGVDADSNFEQASALDFPVQDEKLRAFLKSLKEKILFRSMRKDPEPHSISS